MTAKGIRRLAGVNVADFKTLLYHIHEAAKHSSEPDVASGRLYTQLQAAITSAKEPGNKGFGSSATGDVMAVAILDEKNRTLLSAEFYIRHSEYRDEEAFKK